MSFYYGYFYNADLVGYVEKQHFVKVGWMQDDTKPVKIEWKAALGDAWVTAINSIPGKADEMNWDAFLAPNTVVSTFWGRVSYCDGSESMDFDAPMPVTDLSTTSYYDIGRPMLPDWWKQSETHTIVFYVSSDVSTRLALHYSTDSGSTFKMILWGDYAQNTVHYEEWTIPSTWSNMGEAVLRCMKYSGDYLPKNYSDYFTLGEEVPVTSGVSLYDNWTGEYFHKGKKRGIYWDDDLSQTGGYVDIAIYDGSSWQTVAQSVTSVHTQWNRYFPVQIPWAATSYAKVRISKAGDPSIKTESGYFTIENYAGVINVLSPIGWEEWTAGSVQQIQWDQFDLNSTGRTTVQIYISYDGGGEYTKIATRLTSDDSVTNVFTWTLPSTVSTSCRIYISDEITGGYYGISERDFSIVAGASVTLESPIGGESWVAKSKHQIKWQVALAASVDILHSTDAGSTWLTLAQSIASLGAPTTNVWTWTIPRTYGNNNLIKVQDCEDPEGKYDESSNFEIVPFGIEVKAPVKNDIWVVGQIKQVSWEEDEGTTNVNVLLSTDAGSSWITLAETVPTEDFTTNVWTWTIPLSTPVGSKCLIRVTDAACENLYGESAKYFGLDGLATAEDVLVCGFAGRLVRRERPWFSVRHARPIGLSGVPPINRVQTQVSTDPTFTATPLWDSGVVTIPNVAVNYRTENQFYPGTPILTFGNTYYVRQKIWDVDGNESDWSD